jgi:mannose-6-phosphate isomerase-like protein (cupin superfamily)
MKKSNTDSYFLGNISEMSDSKGYIVGKFMDKYGFYNSQTDEVEVAWKKLTSEDSYNKGHYHKKGVEVNIVISGSCQLTVNGDKVKMRKGNYLIVYPESTVSNFMVKNKAEIIVVKAPSVADDKYETNV